MNGVGATGGNILFSIIRSSILRAFPEGLGGLAVQTFQDCLDSKAKSLDSQRFQRFLLNDLPETPKEPNAFDNPESRNSNPQFGS